MHHFGFGFKFQQKKTTKTRENIYNVDDFLFIN